MEPVLCVIVTLSVPFVEETEIQTVGELLDLIDSFLKDALEKETLIRGGIQIIDCSVPTVVEHVALLMKDHGRASSTPPKANPQVTEHPLCDDQLIARSLAPPNHLALEVAGSAAPKVAVLATALMSVAQSFQANTTLSSLADVRLLTASMPPLKVTTASNLFLAMLGERGGRFSSFLRKNPKLTVLLYLLWLVGVSLGLLSLFKRLPASISALGALLMLPFLLPGVGSLISDLAWLLLFTFDTWYVLINILGATIPLCIMLNDLRALFIGAFALCAMFSLFADAMPLVLDDLALSSASARG
jgi:hypothetical protein